MTKVKVGCVPMCQFHSPKCSSAQTASGRFGKCKFSCEQRRRRAQMRALHMSFGCGTHFLHAVALAPQPGSRKDPLRNHCECPRAPSRIATLNTSIGSAADSDVQEFSAFGECGRLRRGNRPRKAGPWHGAHSMAAQFSVPWYSTIVVTTDGRILDGANSDKRNLRLDPHGTDH